MPKSAKSKAEKMFATTQNKDSRVVKQKEKRQQDRADPQTTLRALRLAKEADEKKAVEQTDSKIPATQSKTKSRLPKSRRPLS